MQAASCLEPLPASVTRLATLVCDPAPELAAVVEIVQYDEALTVNLLRAANSSWSASRVEVATVKDAVIRLGAGPVLTLALGVNVRVRLRASTADYGLPEGELWRHSVAASLAAELIALHARHRPPPEVSTAALLHDVGKLVIARFVERALLLEIRAAVANGASRLDAERKVLGTDHARLGGVVAASWALPHALGHAITHHHEPELADLTGHPRDPGGRWPPPCISPTPPPGVSPAPPTTARTARDAFERAAAYVGLDAAAFDEVCRTAATRLDVVMERFA